MPFARRGFALALTVAALTVGIACAIPSAVAQDPAGAGQGKGKGNAKAGAGGKKKAAPRRRPQVDPVGVIYPYPLGGALIIRHTPETHDEIRALLDMLRYD